MLIFLIFLLQKKLNCHYNKFTKYSLIITIYIQIMQSAHTKIIPPNHKKIKKIWWIAFIIFSLTLIEFSFAFFLPRGYTLYTIFILLTLAKAYYIIGEFMHLRTEKKALVYATLLPCLFLIGLLLTLWLEAKQKIV